ncbi:hypothetical protein HDU67_004352 [Dinochytrium kinnereticum]|nr:hypothetical protein HDU67_004352 [Dinochytrium kinnereticum]
MNFVGLRCRQPFLKNLLDRGASIAWPSPLGLQQCVKRPFYCSSRLHDQLPPISPTPNTAFPIKENIYTWPNLLTFSRLAISPVIGYWIVTEQYTIALAGLSFAAATDLVDGWLARRLNQKSFLGSALDPAADKVLMTVLVIALSQAGLLSKSHLIAATASLAFIILGRDIGLTLGAMVLRYISLPKPKSWSRYWDITLPSAEVMPPMISKVNTALQLCLMTLSLASPVFGIPLNHAFLEGLRWTVAGTTIASGLAYMFDRKLVKLKVP